MHEIAQRWGSTPVFVQPKGKPWCGPAAAQTVLAFHGREVPPVERIVAEFKQDMNALGTDMASLGMFFLRRGFKAKIVFWLPAFPSRFQRLTVPPEAEHEVLKWCARNVATKRGARAEREGASYRKTLPLFIKNGGKVFPRPVCVRDIKAALSQERPPILNLNMAILFQKRKRYAGHYVVPVDWGEDIVVVRDPAVGEYHYDLHLVLHALYSWRSGALFVTPRES